MNLSSIRKKKLSEALEEIYRKYNRRSHAGTDPLELLYSYHDVRDREIAGLVASSLAFGGVKQIRRSIGSVLTVMDDSPAEYLRNTSTAEIKRDFPDFKHRWITGEEIAAMLVGVKGVIERYGSLEACFNEFLNEDDEDVIPALTVFVNEIICGDTGAGVCLLPSPCKKSACKRLNLYLRWMVRKDEIDPGGWDAVPVSKLIVPLDTHIFRLSRVMGFTGRRQANLRAAREVTDAFRVISPEDPVKYDFALTRLMMNRDRDRTYYFIKLGIREADLK
jgi:uncharacterized protein (TIGR02757 family)